MVHKIKVLFATLALSLAIAVPVAIPAYAVETDVEAGLCSGAKIALGETACTDNGEASTGVSNLIKQVINIISVVVGVVAVIMIIIGGLRYITSGGDSSSVSNAKNTILYAIVGLVVVALAQLIVRFVIARLAEATP